MLKRAILLFVVCLLPVMPVQALSPEMEMDRYLLAAQKHVRQGNYHEAEQYLQRAVALQLTPPAEFYYVYGEVLQHNGKWQLARETLEKYLQQAGRDGEYYRDALELLTLIEEGQIKPLPDVDTVEGSVLLESKDSERIEWLDKLQELYLSESPQDALVLHINGLLRNFALHESRVININRTDDQLYKISVPQRGDIQVTERRSGKDGYQFSNSKLSVFGINPYIQYRCDRQDNRCVVQHPVSNKPWMQIRRDEKAATELSKSLTALIRELQG